MAEGSGEEPIRYPTYDEWLAEQGLPPDTIPTPVGVNKVDLNYHLYLFDPMYVDETQYEQGKMYVYGCHQVGNRAEPIYGPSEWHHWFPDLTSLGEGSFESFGKRSRFENILGRYGYLLGDAIAIGTSGNYDNQIWRVSKMDMEKGELVDYACKIVHVRNVEAPIITAVQQILKEARLLQDLNHESVMKITENIHIEESTEGSTRFPYLFVASIMEMMSGTVDSLITATPNWILPEEQCFWILKDISAAIDYLHNGLRDPNGARLRVVHMAIRTANILFKGSGDRNRFKLADFEEAIIYDRNPQQRGNWNPADPESLPPDYLPDPTKMHYWLIISAPEAVVAGKPKNTMSRKKLKIMANDVYMLATVIGYCLSDNHTVGGPRVQRMYEMIQDMMKIAAVTPPPRHTLQHLILRATHPTFTKRATIRQVVAHPYLNRDHFEPLPNP